MSTRRPSKAAAVGLPDLLTVEEAGRLLRVGRTKAYAMAREWRTTSGRSGLPVVDLGNVLRVPRRELEARLGVELSNETDASGPAEGAAEEVSIPVRSAPPETTAAVAPPATTPRPPAARRKPRRGHRHPDGQLSFFQPEVDEAGQEDRREGRGPLWGGPHGAAS